MICLPCFVFRFEKCFFFSFFSFNIYCLQLDPAFVSPLLQLLADNRTVITIMKSNFLNIIEPKNVNCNQSLKALQLERLQFTVHTLFFEQSITQTQQSKNSSNPCGTPSMQLPFKKEVGWWAGHFLSFDRLSRSVLLDPWGE